MEFIEIETVDFIRLWMNPKECEKNILYGAQFSESYEVIDYTYEFAAYKFKNLEEMKGKIEEKYNVTDFSNKVKTLEGSGQTSIFDYV